MAIDRAKKRPISITILSWLYIVVGALSTAAHYAEFRITQTDAERSRLDHGTGCRRQLLPECSCCGARIGRDGWRWLWMATHVVISAFHLMHGLLIHSVLFVVIAYLLFRREAREYFARPD